MRVEKENRGNESFHICKYFTDGYVQLLGMIRDNKKKRIFFFNR